MATSLIIKMYPADGLKGGRDKGKEGMSTKLGPGAAPNPQIRGVKLASYCGLKTIPGPGDIMKQEVMPFGRQELKSSALSDRNS